jgi:hypothetical protein
MSASKVEEPHGWAVLMFQGKVTKESVAKWMVRAVPLDPDGITHTRTMADGSTSPTHRP